MTAPSNDHAGRHGGRHRRRQDREAAEAQWLDDGGAAEERRDRVSFRDVR